jgi:hypothetical protein
MVFLISPLMGKPRLKQAEAKRLPAFTSVGFESKRNNKTARPSSASLLPRKATSVQSKDSMQKD